METLEQRIRQLVEEGKLNEEEAQALRHALAKEQSVGVLDSEIQLERTVSAPPSDVSTRPLRLGKAAFPEPPSPPTPLNPLTPSSPPTPPLPPKPSGQRSQAFSCDRPIKKLVVQMAIAEIEIQGGGQMLSGHASGPVQWRESGDVVYISTEPVDTDDQHGWLKSIRQWLGGADLPEEDPQWLKSVRKALGKMTRTELKLIVPDDLEIIEMSVLSGDCDIRGFEGHLKADLKTGDLDLEGVSSFEIKSMAGDIDIKNVLSQSTSSLSVGAGDCSVQGFKGHLKVDLSAGDLDLRDVSSFEVKSLAGDIDIDATLIQGTSSISVGAGDIDVRLRESSSVSLQVDAKVGDLHVQGFDPEYRSSGPRVRYSGQYGDGQAQLNIKATAGDISVEVKR